MHRTVLIEEFRIPSEINPPLSWDEMFSPSPSKSLRALYLSLEETTGAGFNKTSAFLVKIASFLLEIATFLLNISSLLLEISSFLLALKLAKVSSVTWNKKRNKNESCFSQIFLCLSSWKKKSYWSKPGILLQLNKYETAPNFIQLNQNLTSDCLLI